jgi:L-fuconolactonase
MRNRYPFIDTHVHLWDTRRLRYPWLQEIPKLNRPHLLEDYLEAVAGTPVEALVFMQCEVDPSQALAEALWVEELAAREPRLQGIVAWAPLEKGPAARPFLESLSQLPKVKGIRRIIQYESDQDFCLRPDFLRGLRMLPEFGWSFDLCIAHAQLGNTARLVRQCPEVSFVLDHIGKPDIRGAAWEPWASELRELSRLPNVCCKISGLITEADHAGWKREDLKPYIAQVVDCFGFERLLFGGDWPVVTLAGQFRQWLEALEWALESASEDARRRLYHDNAQLIYRLPGGGE